MDQEQVKQAELQKEAEERILSFEFGSDVGLADLGIDKQALFDLLGCTQEQWTEAGIACIKEMLEKAPESASETA